MRKCKYRTGRTVDQEKKIREMRRNSGFCSNQRASIAGESKPLPINPIPIAIVDNLKCADKSRTSLEIC